jgi:pimeloyl-ACP methyl ester carboxylesterase
MPHEYRIKRALPKGTRDQREGVTAMVANWIHALYDIPWLYNLSYVLWIGHGLGGSFVLMAALNQPSPKMAELAAAGMIMVFGALSIILSRPLAEARNDMPMLYRVWDEGYMGFVDYAPWWFRFTGSFGVGFAIGLLSWVVIPNLTAAIIVGLVGGVAVWVWTWSLFPDMDE